MSVARARACRPLSLTFPLPITRARVANAYTLGWSESPQQGSHPKLTDIKQLWAARQKGWVTDATFTQAVKQLVA